MPRPRANAVTSPNRPPSRECVPSAEIAASLRSRHASVRRIRSDPPDRPPGIDTGRGGRAHGHLPPHLHASLRPCPPHARRRARRRAAAAHRRRKGLPLRTLVPLPALPAHPHRNTRCPACRRNEDSEILGQPNTTYNPVNTVIMEKIALPTRNGAVDDHSATANATRSSRSTPTAASPAARRYPPPKAAAVNPTSPPPARHGRRRDACRQHGRRGEKRPPTQRYRRHPRLPWACRGGRRSLSGRPDRRFATPAHTSSRRRLSRTPRDDRLAPRRMTETGADGTIRNPSAAIFFERSPLFSVKSRFPGKCFSYFCLAESSPTARRSLAAPG